MATLRVRLTLALVGLVLLLGILHVGSTWITTEAYIREVNQKLNLDLAEKIAHETSLIRAGNVDSAALEELFHSLMVINPSIELYLLDPGGRVLAFSAPAGKVQLESVSLEPIQQFLEVDGELPILGDNPRNPDRRKVFSAAPIRPDGESIEGYLYIVLGGDLYDSAAERLAASYILRLSLWTGIAAVLVAVAAGLLIFGRLTRRLWALHRKVSRFESLQLGSKEKAIEAGDEIGRLESTFDGLVERVEAYLEETENLHRERRELVSSVSHDLRTPIAALSGYLETLQLKEETLSPEERREYVEIALRHSERLGELVDELFELTRLDAADVELNLEAFSLSELVQDNVQRFRLQAEQRGLEIVCHSPESLPQVVADIRLIERALVNLIENAIRFTAAGGRVEVGVEMENGLIEVSVEDTGQGIASSELPRIFDRFYRGRSATTDDRGSGLGLAIAHRVVELHGGRIVVKSEEGKGSRFSFSLAGVEAAAAG
ncbi:MAG: HAMP domain-containing histidine kinase [Acidobacteria bacterium]|nr:MAG: HAMP domain-containing histidine kinase [Acidobacteriota bacterium]